MCAPARDEPQAFDERLRDATPSHGFGVFQQLGREVHRDAFDGGVCHTTILMPIWSTVKPGAPALHGKHDEIYAAGLDDAG